VKTKQANRRPSVARVVSGVRELPGFRNYPALYVGSALRSRRYRDDLASVRAFLVFIGHPRSGHSLVGSLLDAHPRMAVSHELDALKYVAAGYRRDQLLTLVLEHARANAAAGRTSWGYSYAVPGQWQGRYRDLAVVGDKRGRMTTHRLRTRPDLLDRLAATVRMPVKVVQVVRNPYDNVATMFKRGEVPIETQVGRYQALCETVDAVAARVDPDDFHRLHHEDLVDDTPGVLAALCGFLGVEAPADYLDACDGVVFPSPNRTRDSAPWNPEAREALDALVAATPWLGRYGFDER
jgi:Sulfotransferase family